MTKAKRPFKQTQVRIKYRHWQLIATEHAVAGKRDGSGEYFEIAKLPDIETAVRFGKRKVNDLEGEQVWPVEAGH